MNKTYWNNEGKFQVEYNEMLNAGFKFTKAEQNAMNKYARYYNDGDVPSGAAYISEYHVEHYLEDQANIAVAKAYNRFNKNASRTIKSYAASKFIGFKAWF